jgi:hypothetical protein
MRVGVALGGLIAAALVLAPANAGVARARACTAKDLRGQGMLQGATGSMLGTIRVRNVSSTACRIGGRPQVAIFDRSGRLLPTEQKPVEARTIGERVVKLVRPGQRVKLDLWWSEWCGSWPQGVYVRKLVLHVRLTTGRRVRFGVRSGRPRCDTRTGSTLGVSPFGTLNQP